jgi:hypothetical protein
MYVGGPGGSAAIPADWSHKPLLGSQRGHLLDFPWGRQAEGCHCSHLGDGHRRRFLPDGSLSLPGLMGALSSLGGIDVVGKGVRRCGQRPSPAVGLGRESRLPSLWGAPLAGGGFG